ncbi:MAG: ABC transporter substrate-binding protein, partial [Aestuariivirgaceae bacterium]|nr:ABC transporter substrate-binding protein [Aestuariivirgaceae bacterium]
MAGAVEAAPRHGIAMFGEPELAEGFAALPYANPDAPKGGTLRQAVTGSFDSLNPFIIKGQVQFYVLRTFVFESLMARSKDEPFTL